MTGLPQPIYEGIVMSSVNSDQFIFNPSIYVNGYSNLYCIKTVQYTLQGVITGLTGGFIPLLMQRAGSIIYANGKYYDSYHKWYGGRRLVITQFLWTG